MTECTIVVLEGDQTVQELLEEALRVLDPHVIRVPLNSAAASAPAISRMK